MVIEFRCSQCQKLLRTGDETAGKQAKCPECGTVMAIPTAGATESVFSPEASSPKEQADDPFAGGDPFAGAGPQGAPGSPPPSSGDPENPYASPASMTMAAGYAPQAAGSFTPSLIDFSDVFGRTWELFKREWGTCLLAVFVAMAIILGFEGVLRIGGMMVFATTGDEGLATSFVLLGMPIGVALRIWLGAGLAIFMLRVARGQPTDISLVFSGGPFFLRALGAAIVCGLIVAVGTLLFIIPGIILSLMLSQFFYLIVDRNLGAMDSLDVSRQIMVGNKLTLFAVQIVAAIVGTLLILCTCGLGIFATVPFLSLLQAVIYLAATGQPMAEQPYSAYADPTEP